ncbi:MAG: glutathione peroxidase [Cytophagales bacterium]|nr:MAG: glutathione peroxidase [Cytophagales bacterium]
MKTMINLILSLALLWACNPKQINSKPDNMTTDNTVTTFYDFKMKTIEGKEISFEQYKGKKVLLVNVASKCGYTPQYEKLQALHEQYGDKVVILGFPANNFGGQEPGSNSEIASFCQKNYGVSFQMFEKISVKGSDMHPLYRWLSTKSENGWNEQAPSWNFCKYLINEKGELVKFFASGIDPMGDEMRNAIAQ